MDVDRTKIEKLRMLGDNVRIGGKGSARRKKKVVHKSQITDDKRLQTSLKKMAVNTIPEIEEVNMLKDDGTVIHFNNPKVQASLQANTFAITGHGESKQMSEMLGSIWNQLGAENFQQLKKMANDLSTTSTGAKPATVDDDEEVPALVENFDEKSKNE